jgi:hypothetical protein
MPFQIPSLITKYTEPDKLWGCHSAFRGLLRLSCKNGDENNLGLVIIQHRSCHALAPELQPKDLIAGKGRVGFRICNSNLKINISHCLSIRDPTFIHSWNSWKIIAGQSLKSHLYGVTRNLQPWAVSGHVMEGLKMVCGLVIEFIGL